ncbi:uncharacterized protein LOC116351900 [Contarinia nasturtii]|uniref:uncharacterized protein LOC116351900 n=1 Tax=Contarinia nasturtii TaxID=265458 RepID=UPI0012D40BBF|nr:uncharacterized protein LOC116351900 [Contarinia nasturtii]
MNPNGQNESNFTNIAWQPPLGFTYNRELENMNEIDENLSNFHSNVSELRRSSRESLDNYKQKLTYCTDQIVALLEIEWSKNDKLDKNPTILGYFSTWFSMLIEIISNFYLMFQRSNNYLEDEFEKMVTKNFVILKPLGVLLKNEANFTLVLKALQPIPVIVKNVEIISVENKKSAPIKIKKQQTHQGDLLTLTCHWPKGPMDKVLNKKFTLRVKLQFEGQVYSEMTLPNVEFYVESIQMCGYSHVKQEYKAWGNVIWNDALQRSIEPPVPQNVPQNGQQNFESNVRWEYLKESINSLCFLITDKRLSDEDLNYIYDNSFATNLLNPESRTLNTRNSGEIDKKSFETKFEWIFEALKTLRDYLREPWKAGHISFITFPRAIQLLTSYLEHIQRLRYYVINAEEWVNIFLLMIPNIPNLLGSIQVIQLQIWRDGERFVHHLIPQENFKHPKRPKLPFSISDLICRQCDVNFGQTFGYLYMSNEHVIDMKVAFPFTIQSVRLYRDLKVAPKILSSLVRSILIDPNEMIIGDCAPYNNDEENNDNWWSWLNNILTQRFYLGIFLVLLFMIVCAYCNIVVYTSIFTLQLYKNGN